MRVDLLCSGSKGNACLVREGNTSILIDCGPPTWKYLKNALAEAGSGENELDALLVTHSHSDHVRQLSHFAHIPVYTCCRLNPKNYKREPVALDLRPITPPCRFQVGSLRVLALPTSHDSGPSMGFVIEGESEKLVYMTDTGYVPEAMIPALRDADYYVFESNHDLEKLNQTNRPFWLKMRIASDTGHLCNQDSARILCSCITKRTRRVVLAHLSEEANSPELALRTLFERLEFSHDHRHSLAIQAASQFEALHFGSIDGSHTEDDADPVEAEEQTAGTECDQMIPLDLQSPSAELTESEETEAANVEAKEKVEAAEEVRAADASEVTKQTEEEKDTASSSPSVRSASRSAAPLLPAAISHSSHVS